MYYISRKDLIRKTKRIHNLIFSDIKETKKELNENNNDIQEALLEQAFLITREERKKIIRDCIVRSFGFLNLSDYSQKTKYLIDIKSMRNYKDVEYTLLQDIFYKLKENLFDVLHFKKPELVSFKWFFYEELKDRENHLRYFFKRSRYEKKVILHSLIAYTNQQITLEYLPDGDFLQKEDGFNYHSLELFVKKFVEASSLSNQKSKINNKNKIDLVIKRFKFKHSSFESSFLNKITHSTMGSEIKDDFISLPEKERTDLLNFISDADMWDLRSQLSEYENRLHNSELNHLISIFNSCFLDDKNYDLSKKNIIEFGNILVAKYS